MNALASLLCLLGTVSGAHECNPAAVVHYPEGVGVSDFEPMTDASPAEEREWELNGLKVQVRGSRETSSRVRLYRDGELLLEEQLGDYLAEDPQTVDLDGDNQPELVLGTFSGGAHCCFTYYVYSLGKKPQRLAAIPAEHSQLRIQRNKSTDGKPSFATLWVVDWTFQFWTGGSFASAPAVPVALRLCEGRLYVDVEHMREESGLTKLKASIQKDQEYQRWASDGSSSFGLDILVGGILDLIYTGNLADVEQLLDALWPPHAGDPKLFLRCLKKQLQSSPYYGGLLELNGNALMPAENGGPDCPDSW
ncbi:MAG: hypothetical protein IT368_01500 [Candidatus Hydrogenedentes bacterium]|nr:hypothetical protein [Candidatus Hydrogenedentota bacterium]